MADAHTPLLLFFRIGEERSAKMEPVSIWGYTPSRFREVLVWQHRNCNGRYVPIRFVALHYDQLHCLAPGVVAAITKLLVLTTKNF